MRAPNKYSLVAACLFGLAAGPAFAVPFAVEGITRDIKLEAGPSGTIGKLTCNGAVLHLTPSSVITTPTTRITPEQLIDPTPFPGRTTAFLNGTCIADGDSTNGVALITNLYVEPAENVLVGPVTKLGANRTQFGIMGVRVVRLTNATTAGRIHAPLPTNAYGFEIDLTTVPDNDESSAEGYLVPGTESTPPTLYAYAIETTAGTARPAPSNVTIQRADVANDAQRQQAKIEVRGGCMFPASTPGTTRQVVIEIQDRNPATGALNWIRVSDSRTGGAVSCVQDPAAPGFGVFRLRNDAFRIPSNAAPARVRASIPGVLNAELKQIYEVAEMTAR